MTASLQGFRAAKRTGIRLFVDQVARVDLDLQTGAVTEVVEVQAASAALDTESATVGQVITEKQITDLPLNGRNFLSLLFLGAGAVEVAGEQGTFRQGVGNAISIMGARPTSNNFMIDGTANIDTAVGTPAAVLSVDAMEEFKEQTKTYSAEYGFSANQINLVSKSGTNQIRGALFYFGRNDALDAKNFFDPPNSAKPKLDQKQFGGTISGPIVKNKTFLLFNYEGARIERGASTFFIVPTPDQLAGRFTSTIIDPLTGQPFPNNTIPQSRFSRLAQVTIKDGWYPAPNTNAPQGNFQLVRTLPQTQNQFTVRVDQDLGSLRTSVCTLHEDDVREHVQRVSDTGRRRHRHRPEQQELAGVPHLAHPEQHRQRVPGRSRGGVGQPGRDWLSPGRPRRPASDGRLHGHP